MITSSLLVSALVEEALGNLYRTAERPKIVTLGSADLVDAVDTSFSLATVDDWQAVNVMDTVEFGSELVYISAKTTDVIPVFTCVRGVEGTTAVAHVPGSTGNVNPAWPRYKVFNHVRDWFRRSNAKLPLIASESYTIPAPTLYISVPADTLKILRVGYLNPTTLSFSDVGGWTFVDDIPTALVATGKAVTVTSFIANITSLIVTRWVPYTVPASEAASVTLPLGAEICPGLYAAAMLVSKREISRLELDNAAEWQKLEVIRNGQNLGITRDLWQQYYAAIDDAKRTQQPPKYRPYRKMQRAI